MIEQIQDWIWNIGGFLFSLALIITIFAFISSWALNRLTWWTNKESREHMFYWIQNKKEIKEYIKDKNGE